MIAFKNTLVVKIGCAGKNNPTLGIFFKLAGLSAWLKFREFHAFVGVVNSCGGPEQNWRAIFFGKLKGFLHHLVCFQRCGRVKAGQFGILGKVACVLLCLA